MCFFSSSTLQANDTVVKPSLSESPVILVVGDSLSAAYNLAEEQGWVHLMAQRMTLRNYPYKVINASVGGATTAAGLQRLPSLLEEHRPKWVILQLGANDGLQGKPVPYITANLEKLIGLSKGSGAEVILVGMHLPPNFGSRYAKPFFEQYAMLAEKFSLPLVPFLLEGVATKSELMQKDGLHPKAEAMPIILETTWKVFEKHFQPVLDGKPDSSQ